MQADKMPEKEQRVLQPNWQVERRECHKFKHLRPQILPPMTHLIQQRHTYSSKAPAPNSATPYDPIGVILFQTTTNS